MAALVFATIKARIEELFAAKTCVLTYELIKCRKKSKNSDFFLHFICS